MPTDLIFKTNGGSTNTVERLRIQSGGNVLIGTTTSAGQLTVDSGTSNTCATFQSSDAGANINLKDNSARSTIEQHGVSLKISSDTGAEHANSDIRFQVDSSTKAMIDSVGRMLVGLTTPMTTGSNDGRDTIQAVYTAGAQLLLARNDTATITGNRLGEIAVLGNDSNGTYQVGASIRFEADANHGDNDKPTRIVFQTCADGSATLTERFRIKSDGIAQFSTTGSYDGYSTADNAFQFRHGQQDEALLWLSNTNSSHTKELLRLDSARSGSSSFYLFNLTTGNLGDDQFLFRADGNGYCDGSWSGGGADYAEYFEWTDGNSSDEDRRGMTVVLDGNKVKLSTSSDSADDIIGVVSASPSAVGDSAHMQWTDKYLRDDYGAYDLDENGERKLNPSYDNTKTYVRREDRKEWDPIGMVGKLRIRKGQKTGTKWIKMRDISASVEEWLVR